MGVVLEFHSVNDVIIPKEVRGKHLELWQSSGGDEGRLALVGK